MEALWKASIGVRVGVGSVGEMSVEENKEKMKDKMRQLFRK
jgi:hypothetical protein